jgi:hypothetical protein
MTSLSTSSRTESTGQRATTWAPLAVIPYGTFVSLVAERAIGVDGPIREYYLDGFESESYRAEIGWPVFRTGADCLPQNQNME